MPGQEDRSAMGRATSTARQAGLHRGKATASGFPRVGRVAAKVGGWGIQSDVRTRQERGLGLGLGSLATGQCGKGVGKRHVCGEIGACVRGQQHSQWDGDRSFVQRFQDSENVPGSDLCGFG